MKLLAWTGKLRESTCLSLDCVLSAVQGRRHLRHITGLLIKTHVRQSDRHGKSVWKKLLGIKYIVTTWFQRFINKLTDHLVSIRSDRSTNPGISALGLVGGGRWWLSMRGDIEGKSPCRFQGGLLLTLFQRGSMCVQAPFTPPVFQSLRESSRVTQKSREATRWPSAGREGSSAFAVFPTRTNGAVNITNKYNRHSLLTSVHLLTLTSSESKIHTVAGGRETSRGGTTLMFWIHLHSVFLFRSVSRGLYLWQLPSVPNISPVPRVVLPV